jgi:CRP-like cAMP-binding protein
MSNPHDASHRFELFAGLSSEQADRLIALGGRRHLRAGETLFPLGAEADRLYLVDGGSLSLMMPLSLKGEHKDVLLEDASRGKIIGFSALVPPHRFTLTACANVDSDVIGLPRAALEERFAAEPEVASVVLGNLVAMMGQRLHRVQAMWMREMQRTVDARFGK